MAKEKNSRSTKLQIKLLLQYMQEHPAFAAGDFNSSRGMESHERQWAELKKLLDDNGPARSIEKWKTCWRDQKRKARMEGGELNRSMAKTGNPTSPVPELSENSALVLDTIGYQMAVGMGPDESPIGFSVPPSTSTAAPSVASKAKRARRALPPDRFIKAQLDTNKKLEDIQQTLHGIKEALEENNHLHRQKLQSQGVITENRDEILYVIEERKD